MQRGHIYMLLLPIVQTDIPKQLQKQQFQRPYFYKKLTKFVLGFNYQVAYGVVVQLSWLFFSLKMSLFSNKVLRQEKAYSDNSLVGRLNIKG